MKKTVNKIWATSLLSLALASASLSAKAYTDSETSSIYTMSFLVVSIALPSVLLDELSTTSKPIHVEKVNYENGQAHVYGKTQTNNNVEFKLNDKVAHDAGLKEGSDIGVNKNKMGYTLGCNGKAVGIVPDQKSQANFQRKQVQ